MRKITKNEPSMVLSKDEFMDDLTGYLLTKVEELKTLSIEEQYRFFKNLHGFTSNRVSKKYRRVWFRDLPDPRYVPDDVSDGLQILTRISGLRGVKYMDTYFKIWEPVMFIQAAVENGYEYFENPNLYPDHIINIWLDQYADEFPEHFIR